MDSGGLRGIWALGFRVHEVQGVEGIQGVWGLES